MVLTVSDMPEEITPDKVKERLGLSKAYMEKVVDRYERSGKGHGSVADNWQEEEQQDGSSEKIHHKDYGRLTSEVRLEVGDLRANFLREAPVHILYYWHIADIQDIIRDVLSKMGEKACASSTKPASETACVQKSQKKGKGKDDDDQDLVDKLEERKFRASVGMAMGSMAYDSITKNITEHKRQLFQLRRERHTIPVQDLEGLKLIDEEIASMRDTIEDLEQRRDAMTT